MDSFEYNLGGNGAYTKGEIKLEKNEILYVYVGEAGVLNGSRTFNGGGSAAATDNGCASGGGATDIRITNGAWDYFESLKSRIMVAGAGAGAERNYPSGVGGALESTSSNIESDKATQTSGYKFGIGMNATKVGNASGAGSGYYGGKTANNGQTIIVSLSSAGGSSYISGYNGCKAITKESTENNITHLETSEHYSGKVFTNTEMYAGNQSMPNYKGGTMIGNSGNGFARITKIG